MLLKSEVLFLSQSYAQYKLKWERCENTAWLTGWLHGSKIASIKNIYNCGESVLQSTEPRGLIIPVITFYYLRSMIT